MEKKMYLAIPFTIHGATVTDVTVVHENEVYVWVKRPGTGRPHRQYKNTLSVSVGGACYGHFDTEAEAWQWIKEILENEIEKLNVIRQENQDELKRIEEIIKTQ